MARIAIISTISIAALTLAGCAATPAVDDGRVHVVASTNVYGSIAEAVGGDLIDVTSLIATAAQDPHSFEASAQDQLAVSKADLVIENGGGYDPFVYDLYSAADSDAVLFRVSDRLEFSSGNEHLWYDLLGMEEIATEIATELATIDPSNSAEYEANAEAFGGEIQALVTSVNGIGTGKQAAITEPVPVYLLEAANMTVSTPDEFSEAIEEGTDVPPAVLAETLELVESADLLAYNSQTASPETEQVRQAAEKAGVPVVEFNETLPDGEDYISWMTANVSAIAAALG